MEQIIGIQRRSPHTGQYGNYSDYDYYIGTSKFQVHSVDDKISIFFQRDGGKDGEGVGLKFSAETGIAVARALLTVAEKYAHSIEGILWLNLPHLE